MGAITPGTVLEISGPPGIGKTAMVVSVAMSARLGEHTRPGDRDQPHDDPEVLIIGAVPSENLRYRGSTRYRPYIQGCPSFDEDEQQYARVITDEANR
jgi:hypothetical protein